MKPLLSLALLLTGLGAANAQQAPAFPAPQAVAPAPGAQTPSPPSELWIYAGLSGGVMGWEVMSARRNTATDSAYIGRFLYFPTPQTEQGITFSVLVQKFEFECATGRYLLGEGLFLSDQLEELATSSPNKDWLETPRGTPEDVLMQVACTGAEVSGQRTAPTLPAAIAGARTLTGR